MSVHVTLTPGEVWLANMASKVREKQNAECKNNPAYTKSKMESDSIAGPRSIQCEMAVAKWLDAHYYFPYQSPDHRVEQHPDVGYAIEVKRIRSEGCGPTIQKKDKGKVVVGARCDEDGEVEIVGYTFANKLENFKKIEGPYSPFYSCPPNHPLFRTPDREGILNTEEWIKAISR